MMLTVGRNGWNGRTARDGSTRRSGLAAAVALPVALSLLLGAGPWDAGAVAQERKPGLCTVLKKGKKKKVKPCVRSLEVKDQNLKSRSVRLDATRVDGLTIRPKPVSTAAQEIGRIDMRLPAAGVVTVTATVSILSAASSSSRGTVLCIIAPAGTGAAQTPQPMFGSVELPLLTASMYGSRGFEVGKGPFTARLICSLAEGSNLTVKGHLGAYYLAERY